jgi:hypothetical protein
MPRRLKTYQTSIGFFDLAVAAPSMKAAAEAWGSTTDVFRKGFGKETDDPEIVAATMAKPGVVLKRPVGSNAAYSEVAELPHLPADEVKERRAKRGAKRKEPPALKLDDKASGVPADLRITSSGGFHSPVHEDNRRAVVERVGLASLNLSPANRTGLAPGFP